MVKHMPAYIFRAIADNGSGVGIFSRNEKITVFPENYLLKNKANCGRSCSGSCMSTCTTDGRKLEDLDGVTNTLSAVREDRILCTNGPDAENVLVHEFAHQVYNYMPDGDHESIKEIYNHAKQHWIWYADSYAMSNPTEYWAEATQAFFHVTNRTDVTGGLNMCNFGQYVCRTESEGRKHIQSRDPLLFDFLSKIYTNNQPNISSGLTTC
ncbi:uncharacterized protein [Mytilus edulis]|uniref:uncharacterized protein n=1 Tax=Mytilus edulis TaxID=6550 RepID=UPI0039F009B8